MINFYTNTISKIKSLISLSRNFKMHIKRIVWFVVDHHLRFMDFYLSNTKENLGVGLQQLSMQCFWHLLGIWIYCIENDIEVISNNIMIVNIARRSFLKHHHFISRETTSVATKNSYYKFKISIYLVDCQYSAWNALQMINAIYIYIYQFCKFFKDFC